MGTDEQQGRGCECRNVLLPEAGGAAFPELLHRPEPALGPRDSHIALSLCSEELQTDLQRLGQGLQL